MTPENKIPAENQATQKPDWKRFVSQKWVARNIPFFLFLALMAVLYIYNGHYADKLVRKMSASERHLKELEFEYKTVKSEVVFRSKASELVKVVAPLGLKELILPPVILEEDNPSHPGETGQEKPAVK